MATAQRENCGQTAAPHPQVSTYSLWAWKITIRKKATSRENCKSREKQERAVGLAGSAPTSRSSWGGGCGRSRSIPSAQESASCRGAGPAARFGDGGCSPTAVGPGQEGQDEPPGERCRPGTVLAWEADGPLN